MKAISTRSRKSFEPACRVPLGAPLGTTDRARITGSIVGSITGPAIASGATRSSVIEAVRSLRGFSQDEIIGPILAPLSVTCTRSPVHRLTGSFALSTRGPAPRAFTARSERVLEGE